MPVAPCELGWGVPEEVAPGTSHHKARHLPHFPQSHLLKVAPCWQGAPETQGSCWPLGQTPILGSNTLVAGQMLSMSDPNRAPCPMQGRDHVQLLVLPCALMVLGPAASEPEQLKAALKGCSEVGRGGWHSTPWAAAPCPAGCCYRGSVPPLISVQSPALQGQGCYTGPCPREHEAAACHVPLQCLTGLGFLLSSSSQGWIRCSAPSQAGSSLGSGLESLDVGPSHLREEELLLGRVG